MASYQMRQRDPLLDQGTQAMLEKRGRELLGIGLLVLALMFTLLAIRVEICGAIHEVI